MHLGIQTGVVPELVMVHPGYGVYQKVTDETLWKEKGNGQSAFREIFILKATKIPVPTPNPCLGSLDPA